MNLFDRLFGKKRTKATPSTPPADYRSTASASRPVPSRANRNDILDSPPITMPFLFDTHSEGPTGYDDDSGHTKTVHVETSSHSVTSTHDTGSSYSDTSSMSDTGGGGDDGGGD